MSIRLVRTAYGSSSSYSGVEVVDGRAAGWQTDGDHVGRFAAPLDADDNAEIEAAAAMVRLAIAEEGDGDEAPPGSAASPPSGVIEQLFIGDDVAMVIDPYEGAIEEAELLVGHLRSVQDDLAAAPVAAVRLVVAGSVSLRHAGDAEIDARSEGVVMTANQWNGDGELVGSVSSSIDVSIMGPIQPGWSAELVPALDLPPLDSGGYGTVTVSGLSADVVGDGVLRPCELGWWIE